MSKFNGFQTLRTAAESYLALGYAVIPLLGDLDPTRPKVAACAWGIYQRQHPALSDVQTWFSEAGIGAAVGIVTGSISRLIVLDFDSSAAFIAFSRRYPDLVETRTVHSAGRALPHLYFRLPSGLHIASQKVAGIDLLSDGRYVVAPPSTFNGQPYKMVRGGMPRTLTDHDIRRLNTFMAAYKEAPNGRDPVKADGIATVPTSNSSLSYSPPCYYGEGLGVGSHDSSRPEGEAASAPSECDVRVLPSPLPYYYGEAASDFSECGVGSSSLPPSLAEEGRGGGKPSKLTRADLHALYTYWLTKGGRNDALFRTALHARDHGWNEAQTRRALITLHTTSLGAPIHASASTPSRREWSKTISSPHLASLPLSNALEKGARSEVFSLRQREAAATIRSAFSRPARKPKVTRQPNAIANTAREWLMQHRMTFVVRTLEGLMQLGYQSGQVFTAEQAITDLKGIVGRDSVYNALNALAPNGKPIFRRKLPSALPMASKEAAKIKSGLKTKKCFFVTEQKSGLIKKGPKHRLYTLPSNRDLCRLLRVKPSGSDTLTRSDLASARQTRMALHRELIKRRPAEYTRAWLAGRLGVSRRTLDAYNGLIPIHRAPTYVTTALSWTNLDRLPHDEPLAGAYIETLYAKKYPALRGIAARLMGEGKFVRLQQRTGSYYWYGSDQPPAQAKTPTMADDFAPQSPFAAFYPPRPERSGSSLPLTPALIFPVGAHGHAPLHPTPNLPLPYSPRPEGEGLGVRVSTNNKKSRYRKPLTNAAHESLAQHIYTRVNQRSTESTRQLSLSNARRLVATYGEHPVRQALRLFEGRPQLNNPTGFFVSVLRSNSRLQAVDNKKGKA